MRAGVRRYAGSELGEQYQQVLSHDTDTAPESPGIAQRTVGDLVDPMRPGGAVELVNVVSNATGQDAAEWSVGRLYSMVGMLEASVPTQ